MELKNKIIDILKILNTGLIEREKHIKLAVLTILAGENLILIGPPGTAKSEISRRVSSIIEGEKYFEYLLTKFTTPEEIFGPISIKNLENDVFKRQTEGYIPKSYIVFLDEIFKANSSILNSLLTMLNERIYHNGAELEKSKLISIIAASNELPIGDTELLALYDRFLTRIVIDYVENPLSLVNINEEEVLLDDELKLHIDELTEIIDKSKLVEIDDEIAKTLVNIKQDIEKEFFDMENEINEIISDRKFVKSIKFLKVAAFSNGKNILTLDDLILLENTYWNDPINIDKIREIIVKNICGKEKNKKEQMNILFESWDETFENIFQIQEIDEEGNLVYIDINGEKTTEDKGDIHLRDELGNYLFYSGHREYIRTVTSSWDHNYQDTNIKTIDGESIFTYEFSNVKVEKSKKCEMENLKKLTIKGNLKASLIKNYAEFKEKNIKLDANKIKLLEDLRRNIKVEFKELEEHHKNITSRKEMIENNLNKNMWLEEKDKEFLDLNISNYFEEISSILNKFNELISKTNEVID